MSKVFRRLWNSISFRLTLNYGLLAALTTFILITFIYFQFIGALRTEYDQQITATTQRLVATLEENGREALIAAIELTLSDRVDSDREIYLLIDENNKKLVGNLERYPLIEGYHDNKILQIEVVRDSIPTLAQLKVQSPTGVGTLIVGHDLSEMGDITYLIGQALLATVFVATVLVLTGAYIFRKELEYRISHIRQTTQQIGAGQLSTRVPTHGNEDELGILNSDINSMLDRIELLMRSARHISDTIAHNIRTPLARIASALQAVDQPEASKTQVMEANRYAIEGIKQLNVLLEKLLQIAELEAGIQRRSFKPCKLNTIIYDMMEMYGVLAEEKGIQIHCAKLDDLSVRGDANLLASALANLLDNAVKYATSRVGINARKEGGFVHITIEDNGPGLPSSEYEHLSKHFYRSDPSSDGHGLGLTSVVGIVHLHKGEISFSSAHPGLRVEIALPLDVDLGAQPG